MLQPPGDLGLEQEAGAAVRVVGMVGDGSPSARPRGSVPNRGPRRRPQAAPGMGPEDAEPLAVGGGRADGEAGGAVGVVAIAWWRRPRRPGRASPRCPGVQVGQVGSPSRPAGGDGGEALLHVAAVLLDVLVDEGLDRGSLLGVEVAAGDEVARPGAGALSRVQAWKAATSWPWSIRPFCRASRPKSRLRSKSFWAMTRDSRGPLWGLGLAQRAPPRFSDPGRGSSSSASPSALRSCVPKNSR